MAMNTDKKYHIRDIESGELVEVSKKQYDAYQNAIELFRPKINGVKGSIQIFGTSESLEDVRHKNYELFYQSKVFKTKD